MLSISKPMYVYLQRPDNGQWVTVGRYKTGAPDEGFFKYAPSYIEAGHTWAIDPALWLWRQGRGGNLSRHLA